MATNLHIDEKLLEKALRLSGKKSKRETVNAALEEYVRLRDQRKILQAFGTLDDNDFWDPPKVQRRRGTHSQNGKRR